MERPTIFAAEGIRVTHKRVVARGVTYRISEVRLVWVTKRSESAGPARLAGALALGYAATMGSCGGVLVGAASEASGGPSLEQWATRAVLIGVAGAALLALGGHIPPYTYTVNANVGGQHVVVFETRSENEARDIEAAINEALGDGDD